jgi:hypothetical protein
MKLKPMTKMTKLKNRRKTGKQVVQTMYRQKLTREQIEKEVQKISNGLKQENFKGTMTVLLHYNDFHAMSGRETVVGDPIDLFTYADRPDYNKQDPKSHPGFTIYLIKD